MNSPQPDRFAISTTRRLTNQWNGKLTQSFVWLRQASSLRQFPLISDVRRRSKVRREEGLKISGLISIGCRIVLITSACQLSICRVV